MEKKQKQKTRKQSFIGGLIFELDLEEWISLLQSIEGLAEYPIRKIRVLFKFLALEFYICTFMHKNFFFSFKKLYASFESERGDSFIPKHPQTFIEIFL